MNAIELRELIKNYKPEQETLDALKQTTLITIVGPTAVGKTTLIEYIARQDPGIYRVVSDVSRPPREGEVNGVDYNFRNQDDMVEDLKKGRYAQVVLSANGDPYGSMPSNYGTTGLAVMSVQASVINIFRELPFKAVRVICIVPPNYDAWRQRIQSHHFTSGDYVGRIREGRESLEFANTDPNVELLMNDDLDFACRMCLDLAHGKVLTAEELANQKEAKHAIEDILARID